MCIVIACDPGLTGAICAIDSARGLLECADLPTCDNGSSGSMKRWVDVKALAALLRDWSARHQFARESVQAVIEKPVAAPTIGKFKRAVPAQTIAAQFDTFGTVRATLAAVTGAQLHYVAPQGWKKFFGIVGENAKSDARACCLRLYPNAPVTRVMDHNRAEAILVGHWLMRRMA